MSRSELQNVGTAPKQLKQFAFTKNGYALPDRFQNRGENEEICAYVKSSKTWTSAISSARAEGKTDTEIYRIGTSYSTRELGDIEIGVKKYLVVGYALRNSRPDASKVYSGQKKQTSVGVDDPGPNNTSPWDNNRPPLLVVAEIMQKQPEGGGMQLYVLLFPKNSLSTPYSIAQDIVFYRHEFRDATTAVKARGTAWNKLVAKRSIQPDGDNILTQKEMKFKRAKDQVRLVFSPNLSLSNEIASLAATFQQTPDPKLLDDIKFTLETIVDDFKYRPLPDNEAMRAFVEREDRGREASDEFGDEVVDQFEESTADKFVEEFCQLWPKVEGVTAERVILLYKGLVELDDELEYKLLKPFVQEGCWRLRKSSCSDQPGEVLKIVAEALTTVRRLFQEEPAAPIRTKFGPLYAAILAKLDEMVAVGKGMEKDMKDSTGDISYDVSIGDVWHHFRDAPDTDSARAAFMQAVRVFMGGFIRKETSLRIMAEDLASTLRKL